jgi:hypothetical protein
MKEELFCPGYELVSPPFSRRSLRSLWKDNAVLTNPFLLTNTRCPPHIPASYPIFSLFCFLASYLFCCACSRICYRMFFISFYFLKLIAVLWSWIWIGYASSKPIWPFKKKKKKRKSTFFWKIRYYSIFYNFSYLNPGLDTDLYPGIRVQQNASIRIHNTDASVSKILVVQMDCMTFDTETSRTPIDIIRRWRKVDTVPT